MRKKVATSCFLKDLNQLLSIDANRVVINQLISHILASHKSFFLGDQVRFSGDLKESLERINSLKFKFNEDVEAIKVKIVLRNIENSSPLGGLSRREVDKFTKTIQVACSFRSELFKQKFSFEDEFSHFFKIEKSLNFGIDLNFLESFNYEEIIRHKALFNLKFNLTIQSQPSSQSLQPTLKRNGFVLTRF